MNIKLALTCPIYNCLSYTKEFVKSIVTEYPFDLIFHDNGSNDGSETWISDASNFTDIPNLEKIHVIRSDRNLGVAKGANSAMQKAYSLPDVTHIIYMNNDILLRQETLDNLVWAWENKPDDKLMLISGEGFHRETFGTVEEAFTAFRTYRIAPVSTTSHNTIPLLTMRFGACYCLFIWDKKAIDTVGWLDEGFELGYFDDNDHAETILEKGYLLAHFSGAPFFHYGSVTMKINNIDNGFTFERNKQRFFTKHNITDEAVDATKRFPQAVARIEEINKIWKKNPPKITQIGR